MSLLKFARELMLGQPTAAILESLGGILSVLWANFKDIDIRDLARFYYILLTHISGEQLSFILENNFESVARINDIMTDNLAASSAVQLANPIQLVARPFLGFRREPRRPLGVQLVKTPLGPILTDGAVASAYLEGMELQETGHAAQIDLAFGYTTNIADGESAEIPECIYAVTVTFGHNPRQSTIAPIELPIVDAALHALNREGEAAKLAVSLELRPIDPVPTSLEVTVEYSLMDGEAFLGRLEDFNISFRDLLIPLPAAIPTGDAATVFSSLWAHFQDEAEKGDTEAVVETVMQTASLTVESLSDLFGDLVVRVASGPEKGALQFEVATILVPRTHILMKGANSNGFCTIRVLTQAYRAIPYLQDYLRKTS